MTWKNMRKFLVVIMDVIIFILVEVQGNELSSTFSHHSSLPFSLPFAELDSDHGTIYNCLEENYAICEEKLKGGHDVLFKTCILTSTVSCMGEKNKDNPILEIVKLEY